VPPAGSHLFDTRISQGDGAVCRRSIRPLSDRSLGTSITGMGGMRTSSCGPVRRGQAHYHALISLVLDDETSAVR
jgi:hypothetical protein